MKDLFERTQQTVDWLRDRLPGKPEIGLILGTGLGGIADRLEISLEIPFEDIPNFAKSTALGHRGRLLFGKLAGKRVFVMQGRFHYYEGYDFDQMTLPVRVIKGLRGHSLFIVSAAGGLNRAFRAGDPMLITDHINLMGVNPLRGVLDDRLGERYPDMSEPYDGELAEMAMDAALELKIRLARGVYVAVQGPSLETPAETRMLRILGADAVGMSTVPEVITAKQAGLRVLAIAAITNVNLPDHMAPISVDSVIDNAKKADPKISALLERVLEAL